jgi:small GTP-binding protein
MSEKNTNPKFKVTIVGDAGVGKTCILSRFVFYEFDQDEKPTIQGTFNYKELLYEDLDNTVIQFDIWDTIGQEKYRSMNEKYYKGSNASIMVYDCTDKKTFENMKNYWYSQIKENSPKNIVLAIAANKSDLFEYEAVDTKEGIAFAKEIGAIFKVVSALSGEGIDDLFKFIGYKLLDPNFNIYEEIVKITEENIIQAKNTIKNYHLKEKTKDTKSLEEAKAQGAHPKKCC